MSTINCTGNIHELPFLTAMFGFVEGAYLPGDTVKFSSPPACVGLSFEIVTETEVRLASSISDKAYEISMAGASVDRRQRGTWYRGGRLEIPEYARRDG